MSFTKLNAHILSTTAILLLASTHTGSPAFASPVMTAAAEIEEAVALKDDAELQKLLKKHVKNFKASEFYELFKSQEYKAFSLERKAAIMARMEEFSRNNSRVKVALRVPLANENTKILSQKAVSAPGSVTPAPATRGGTVPPVATGPAPATRGGSQPPKGPTAEEVWPGEGFTIVDPRKAADPKVVAAYQAKIDKRAAIDAEMAANGGNAPAAALADPKRNRFAGLEVQEGVGEGYAGTPYTGEKAHVPTKAENKDARAKERAKVENAQVAANNQWEHDFNKADVKAKRAQELAEFEAKRVEQQLKKEEERKEAVTRYTKATDSFKEAVAKSEQADQLRKTEKEAKRALSDLDSYLNGQSNPTPIPLSQLQGQAKLQRLKEIREEEIRSGKVGGTTPNQIKQLEAQLAAEARPAAAPVAPAPQETTQAQNARIATTGVAEAQARLAVINGALEQLQKEPNSGDLIAKLKNEKRKLKSRIKAEEKDLVDQPLAPVQLANNTPAPAQPQLPVAPLATNDLGKSGAPVVPASTVSEPIPPYTPTSQVAPAPAPAPATRGGLVPANATTLTIGQLAANSPSNSVDPRAAKKAQDALELQQLGTLKALKKEEKRLATDEVVAAQRKDTTKADAITQERAAAQEKIDAYFKQIAQAQAAEVEAKAQKDRAKPQSADLNAKVAAPQPLTVDAKVAYAKTIDAQLADLQAKTGDNDQKYRDQIIDSAAHDAQYTAIQAELANVPKEREAILAPLKGPTRLVAEAPAPVAVASTPAPQSADSNAKVTVPQPMTVEAKTAAIEAQAQQVRDQKLAAAKESPELTPVKLARGKKAARAAAARAKADYTHSPLSNVEVASTPTPQETAALVADMDAHLALYAPAQAADAEAQAQHDPKHTPPAQEVDALVAEMDAAITKSDELILQRAQQKAADAEAQAQKDRAKLAATKDSPSLTRPSVPEPTAYVPSPVSNVESAPVATVAPSTGSKKTVTFNDNPEVKKFH